MIEQAIKLNENIRKLYPQVVTIRDDVAYDQNENIVEYDKAAVEAELTKE